MKVRNDFVTNSSSSGFIIAYKDNNTMPIKAFSKMVEFILESTGEYHQTERADIVRDIDSYNEYILDRYAWNECQTVKEVVEEDEDLRKLYNEAAEYINDGYAIAIKRVDNWDDETINLIRSMEDSVNFVILREEEY